MKTYCHLYQSLCSYQNLELAYKKARKRKTQKLYVINFEKNLKQNLIQLQFELLTFSYRPALLKHFTIRDPKTRKICKSIFRDRIIHHALVNILEPIFEKTFIHDSYANRKHRGTTKAIERFDYFKRKTSYNGKKLSPLKDGNYVIGYCLKADIRKYFENIDHQILLETISKKIKDEHVLWLTKLVLSNYSRKREDKKPEGMPLGNLTSQFLANLYLNQLDYFIKHQLKAKYYLRYVDDFVILHNSKATLSQYHTKINHFLKSKLNLELHPEKSGIRPLHQGINLLGFRIFYHHKLLKKNSFRKTKNKLKELKTSFYQQKTTYDFICQSFQGWLAYAKQANTHNLRKILANKIETHFPNQISSIEINKSSKLNRCVHSANCFKVI